MRHIAAYLLLVLGGNESPSADDVKKVLASAGVEVNDERLSKLLSSLEGKNLEELIEAGMEKLAKVPTGGGGGPVAAAGGEGAAAAEEEEEEEEEEVADGAVGGLFGDDDDDDY